MAIRLPVLFLAAVAAAFAQQAEPSTRAEQIERQRDYTAKTPLPDTDDILEKTVIWASDRKLLQFIGRGVLGISPVLGGMTNGSGFALGLQFLRPDLLRGNMSLRASVRESFQNAQLLDLEAGFPHLANGKLFADIYVRHRNYPRMNYYGPGPDSAKTGRSAYRMEDTQFDGTVGFRPTKWLRVGGTGGYYRPNVGPGTSDDFISADKQYSPAQTPGIDIQTDYFRGGVLAQVDTRDNPYGPKAGGQYYGRFDYYKDRNDLGFSFRRFTGEVQHFIPLFERKRVIAARVRTIMSFEHSGNQVPFYLQPSLGGSEDLRGFRPFRFYGNNSIVGNVEWRWEVATGVDAALFVDAGKVAPRPGLLNFANIEKSYGGGFRFRAPNTGAVITRLDFAVSREGFMVSFVFSDIFAVPAIRTGRELSPPPGRLP